MITDNTKTTKQSGVQLKVHYFKNSAQLQCQYVDREGFAKWRSLKNSDKEYIKYEK